MKYDTIVEHTVFLKAVQLVGSMTPTTTEAACSGDCRQFDSSAEDVPRILLLKIRAEWRLISPRLMLGNRYKYATEGTGATSGSSSSSIQICAQHSILFVWRTTTSRSPTRVNAPHSYCHRRGSLTLTLALFLSHTTCSASQDYRE